MATFIKGVSDQFGPMQLYRPDYQFLTQVYGTKQAEYDRGVNMVKSIYNSALNSALTNSENQAHRQELFKKLQGSLRSMTNVDLSNPTNIARASSLVDPISKDQELAYDMAVTSFHQKQKQLMESYKNSQDPKMRAMYSDFSRMDIEFAEQDLRNAKRGDGSITKVQPREFTPFEDVNEYLRKAAKKDGLEITTETPDGRGYMLKRVNGMGAVPAFNNWAKSVMGNRFDRQFAAMGRVSAEAAIRNEMTTKNIGRDEAVRLVSEKLLPTLNVKQSTQGIAADKEYKKLSDEIAFYEKRFPNGFPTTKPEIAEEYQRLIKARDERKADFENARNEVSKLQSEGSAYIASNLYNVFTQEAKEKTALQFATAHATRKMSVEVSPDQKWISEASRALQERMFNARLDFDKQKFAYQMQQDSVENQMKMLELQGKGYAGNEQFLGVGTSSDVFASDMLTESYKQSEENIYRSAFNGENGLMKLVVNSDSDYGKYYSVIAKVKQIANGGQTKLTGEDIEALSEYVNKIDGRLKSVPTNAASAQSLLNTLATGTYNAAKEKLALHSKTYNTKEARKYQAAFQQAAGEYQKISGEREQLNADLAKISAEVVNPDGSIKELYKGARIIGNLGNGVYNIDLSNVSEAAKARVSGMISSFQGRQKSTSYNYRFTKLTPAEIFAFFKSDTPSAIATTEGSTLDPAVLKNMNDNDLVALFGDNARVNYDAGSKNITVTLDVSQKDGIAKNIGLKPGQSLNVTIPYSRVQSSMGALSRFSKVMINNNMNYSSLGVLTPFISNPDARVKAESFRAQSGFDYTVTGIPTADGGRKLLFAYSAVDPNTGKRIEGNKYFDYTPGNAESLEKVYQNISQVFEDYLTAREMAEKNIE